MHPRDEALPLQPDRSFQAPSQVSIIDLVLAATESSEDEFEINDGIAGLIRSGAVRILARKDDPMLARADEPAARPLPALNPASR
jgi:hypothetical protein